MTWDSLRALLIGNKAILLTRNKALVVESNLPWPMIVPYQPYTHFYIPKFFTKHLLYGYNFSSYIFTKDISKSFKALTALVSSFSIFASKAAI